MSIQRIVKAAVYDILEELVPEVKKILGEDWTVEIDDHNTGIYATNNVREGNFEFYLEYIIDGPLLSCTIDTKDSRKKIYEDEMVSLNELEEPNVCNLIEDVLEQFNKIVKN